MSEIPPALNIALAEQYRLVREVGSGGMSRVYLANDIKHDRQVAIKVLKSEFGAMLGAERFLSEIKVTAKLQHPNLLPLFDSGEAAGRLYYVMPYIEGETLRERIERDSAMPSDEVVRIVNLIAGALDFAHARGVIHRDLKPENVLLQAGQPVISDFGIALAVRNAGGKRITQSGFTLGTPEYMSPEQAAGDHEVDARSDQYALAVLAYEMLTGEPPHHGATAQIIINRVVSEPARSVRTVRPDVPEGMDAALLRGLEKDPAARFPSCGDFARTLAQGRRGSTGVAAPPSRPRSLLPLGALLLAVATGTAVWWTQGKARAAARLPQVERLAKDGHFTEAFAIAKEVAPRLEADSAFTALYQQVSIEVSVRSEPAGASVYVAGFSDTTIPDSADGTLIGTTPIARALLARDDYRMILRAPGHEPARRIVSRSLGKSGGVNPNDRELEFDIPLSATGSVPEGMEAIPGGRTEILGHDVGRGQVAELAGFYLDRYEVSNAQYAEFIQAGGYRESKLWPVVHPGRYVDRTGLPGPREWSGGVMPAGRGDYPVTGVSYYEASAYCAWKGKRLPNLFEWEKASRNDRISKLGILMPWGQYDPRSAGRQRANFSGNDAAPVNSFPFAISPFGIYNMAGNVKEWLFNRVGKEMGTTGGSWQDPIYLYPQVGSATEGSATLGFRCAKTQGNFATNGDRPLSAGVARVDWKPVGSAEYQRLLTAYQYDRRPANVRGQTTTLGADWTRERFWIDGPKGDSILAYLYLPRAGVSPYQTVVLVPSSAAFTESPVTQQAEQAAGTVIKAGRALLVPVLTGMIERQAGISGGPPAPASVEFRDWMVRHATEIRLLMDYAATRPDIDSTRFAYMALSFGAASRIVFAAVDPRFKAAVLLGVGVDERLQPTLPEAANFNFAPHITAPKLVINGRQDEEHPWLSRGKAMWDLLPEPKELLLVEGAGHAVPVEARSSAINAFLDRTLGPIAR